MTSLLFGICISALLSITSLLVVMIRVSPLTSPAYAIPAFLISLLLAISSVGALGFYGLWTVLPIHTWDAGKLLSVALRQGIFLGLAITMCFGVLMLQMLTWWIVLLILAVFVLIEAALNT